MSHQSAFEKNAVLPRLQENVQQVQDKKLKLF